MQPDDDEHLKRCPLAAVDRRLEDVHQHWHHADQAYFHPEGFRVAIQTAIQTLRTVTFILQANKDAIPEFDAWYGQWQERLRADPLMRWMVDARNKIEKQGDLEVHSFVHAEIMASYLNEGPIIDVPARLFDDPAALLGTIPERELREHVSRHGILRIERRWVENTLPEHELLDAVATAYGRIAELVRDAHRQMGLAHPVTTDMETGQQFAEGRGGRLPCMIGHGDARSLDVSLADGRILGFKAIRRQIKPADALKAAERYGDMFVGMFGPEGATQGEMASSMFETARKVFLKDGYHDTLYFFFRDRKLVRSIGVRPEDQAQKYLLMRKLANEVTKHGADAVVSLSEVWMAPGDPQKPYQRPADSPVRQEALTATLVTKSGDPVQFTAFIHRDGERLTLDDTEVDHNPALFAFAPVYEAWGRPIPVEWVAKVKKLLAVD